MGLAAAKKRTKLSHDPQNTAWARNTSSYGARQLLAQGWKPGQTLGASSSPHAAYYTKGSALHIRIARREEGLGLGAKAGAGIEHGECTGLGALQDLLGRLNGKSEEAVEKERRGRGSVKRMMWAEKRYGGMAGFVRGGVLVGDGLIEENEEEEAGGVRAERKTAGSSRYFEDKVVGGKRLGGETSGLRQPATQPEGVLGEKVEGKKRRAESSDIAGATSRVPSLPKVNSEKSEKVVVDLAFGIPAVEERDLVTDSNRQRREEKALRKALKAQRRLERLRRKEAKKRLSEKAANVLTPVQDESVAEAVSITAEASTSTKTLASDPVPLFGGNRHAVRSRYITQKKRALLDPKALNEILMIKA